MNVCCNTSCKKRMESNFEQKSEVEATQQTGEAINTPKSKKTVYTVLGIGIGLVAILVICIVSLVAKGKGFSGDKGKVLQAISNTAKEQPKFLQDLNFELVEEITKTKDYSLAVDATVGYYKGAINYNEKGSERQFSGNVGMSFLQLDVLGEITPKLVKLQIPMVHDRILTYDYTAKKTGAIVDYIGSDALDAVDSVLKQQLKTDKAQESSEELAKVIEKEFNSLAVQKIDKKDLMVDSGLKPSNGYRMTIKKDNVERILDACEDIFKSYYPETLISAEEVEDMMEDARLELESMKDIYLDFYIYEKKLSAIVITNETQEEQIQVLFEGGKTRTEHMKLLVADKNGDTAEISLEGKTEGNLETYKMIVTEDGESIEVANVEYDTKSGEFKLFLTDSYSETELSGTIKTDKNQWQLSLHQTMEDSELPEVAIAITLKKGAVIKKMEGTEFDIGNASDVELQGILEEYFGFLFGL